MALPAASPGPNNHPTLGLVNELFHEARRAKRRLLPEWNRWYRMVRNKTWSDNRQAWLPSPQSSEIYPTYHTLVAWMTDQRPHMFVSPIPDLSEFNTPPNEDLITKRAHDMQQVLDSWWITYGAQTQVQMALWDMFTFGCGIYKTGWDPTLRQGEGDLTFFRTDPYAILPDPEASSMADARYIIEARRVPMFEIKRRFPSRAHLVRPDKDSSSGADQDSRPRAAANLEVVPMGNPNATGVTGQFPGTPTPGIPPLFGPPGVTPDDYTTTVLLKEVWVRSSKRTSFPVIENGERVDDINIDVPYWELICEANGVILNEDTDNPFDHGQSPYIRQPMVEIGEFWSVAMGEQLGPAQIALNRLLAALQTNAELIGNPILLEPESSGINRTKIINRPGGRLTTNMQATNLIRWLDPPSMPAAVMDLVGFWRDTIDRISGISAVARGGTMRRREAAASVDAVQEASHVRIRDGLRNMEEALRAAGQQLAANAVQFFIEPRAVPIVGPNGSEHYLQLGQDHFQYPEPIPGKEAIENIPLRFDVWIQAGSSLPISRQARAAEVDSLFFMGVVDEEAVLTAHDIPDREAIMQRVAAQRQQAAQQEAMAGAESQIPPGMENFMPPATGGGGASGGGAGPTGGAGQNPRRR